MDDTNSTSTSPADGDPCVAEFLARHGIANQEAAEQEAASAKSVPIDVTQTISQPIKQPSAKPTAAPQTVTTPTAPTTPPPVSPTATIPVPPLPNSPKRPQTTPQAAPQSPTVTAPAANAAAAKVKRPPTRAKRQASREVGALRQLRANSIAVSLSKSTQIREKLNQAARFLAISLLSGLLAMGFAFVTTSIGSFVFFAALIALVIGIVSVYRSTLIMTRLHRIAKI